MANMANSAAYVGQDGRMWVDVDTNKTLAAIDNGYVQNVIADAITVTLPSTALGLCYTVRNGGVAVTSGATGTGSNGTALVKVSPAAADGISGSNFTAAVNKAAQNTKTTSIVGDYIQLIGTGTAGVTGWNVVAFKGTWAREA
jgi:hypothetical protein